MSTMYVLESTLLCIVPDFPDNLPLPWYTGCLVFVMNSSGAESMVTIGSSTQVMSFARHLL